MTGEVKEACGTVRFRAEHGLPGERAAIRSFEALTGKSSVAFTVKKCKNPHAGTNASRKDQNEK